MFSNHRNHEADYQEDFRNLDELLQQIDLETSPRPDRVVATAR
jgi:hypothetical protein